MTGGHDVRECKTDHKGPWWIWSIKYIVTNDFNFYVINRLALATPGYLVTLVVSHCCLLSVEFEHNFPCNSWCPTFWTNKVVPSSTGIFIQFAVIFFLGVCYRHEFNLLIIPKKYRFVLICHCLKPVYPQAYLFCKDVHVSKNALQLLAYCSLTWFDLLIKTIL